ncbi:MAG: hypothetical protein LBF64_06505, partial [Oscillospiraceae bacterium]|nr:hypothetical protein [Oscillospiraceae bacterium]
SRLRFAHLLNQVLLRHFEQDSAYTPLAQFENIGKVGNGSLTILFKMGDDRAFFFTCVICLFFACFSLAATSGITVLKMSPSINSGSPPE